MKQFIKVLVVGLAVGAISQAWGNYNAQADNCDPVKQALLEGLADKVKVLVKNEYFRNNLITEANNGDKNAVELLKTIEDLDHFTTAIEIVEPGP